jgi:hypothetical protein
MNPLLCTLTTVGALLTAGVAYADHDETCKNIHGRVTVVTADSVTVDDQYFKVGKTTRVTKGGELLRAKDVKTGDIVCVDIRGKDDLDGEIAGLVVLNSNDRVPVRQREIIREKVSYHDKNCPHKHARVTRVNGQTLIIDNKPIEIRETVRVTKGDKIVTVREIKDGDYVCLHNAGKPGYEETVTTVMVLEPSDVKVLFPESEVIERETIREKIRDDR